MGAAQLGAKSIGTSAIADHAIGALQLAANAVTSGILAANAVLTANIGDGRNIGLELELAYAFGDFELRAASLIDEPELTRRLADGQLAGAFLDVFGFEPLSADSPLWDLPNVIVTPHSAGFADTNAQRVAQRFIANLIDWRAGRPLRTAGTGL